MAEQKRTRDEAYAVAWEALNLAQDLLFHAELRDIRKMKLRYRFFPWIWWRELKEDNENFKLLAGSAYKLLDDIYKWADEYPVEGKQSLENDRLNTWPIN